MLAAARTVGVVARSLQPPCGRAVEGERRIHSDDIRSTDWSV
jgi:hypothetical protein